MTRPWRVIYVLQVWMRKAGQRYGQPEEHHRKTFREAAVATGQKPEKAKRNVLELLQKTLGGKNHFDPSRKAGPI